LRGTKPMGGDYFRQGNGSPLPLWGKQKTGSWSNAETETQLRTKGRKRGKKGLTPEKRCRTVQERSRGLPLRNIEASPLETW